MLPLLRCWVGHGVQEDLWGTGRAAGGLPHLAEVQQVLQGGLWDGRALTWVALGPEESWVGGPVLTWLRGRQQKAAAHCAGRCPGTAARGRLRGQPGWHSRGSCPSTGAASQLWGNQEGQSWAPPQQPCHCFLCRLCQGGEGEPGPVIWVQGRGTPGGTEPGIS